MSISPKPDYDVSMATIIKGLRREIEAARSRPSLTAETVKYLTPEVLPVPKAPTGLTVTENLPLPSADGSPIRSRVLLSWSPVTQDITNEPIAVNSYEVWGTGPDGIRVRLTSSTTTTARVDLQSALTFDIEVRAGTIRGLWSAWSAAVEVTGASDLTPMAAPTPPTLSTRLGTIKVEWDGNLVSGPAPDKFRYVFAEVAAAEAGPYSPLGPSFAQNGTVLTGLTAGETVWVRLIAVDTLRLASPPSAAASIVVEGVGAGDIDVGTITIDKLDDDVQDALLGEIDPTRIADDSISTRKLLVANLSNLLEDPSFEHGDVAWTSETAGVSKATDQPRSGAKSLRVEASTAPFVASETVRPIQITPEREYLLAGYVAALSGGVSNGVGFSIAYGTTPAAADGVDQIISSQQDPTSSYVRIAGQWVAPPAASWIKVRIEVFDDTDASVYVVDDMALILRADAELIVDGAVIAGKIAAEAVTAENLAADSVSANAIQAGAVTAEKILAETITANEIASGAITADKIEAGQIEVYHLAATFGSELDITSNEAVNIIVGQIDEATARIDENGQVLEELTTYYKFGPSGATIESADSIYALSLSPTGVAILEAGLEVSRWDSGQLIVPSFVGVEVELGNHKIEKYTTGTVVRAL